MFLNCNVTRVSSYLRNLSVLETRSEAKHTLLPLLTRSPPAPPLASTCVARSGNPWVVTACGMRGHFHIGVPTVGGKGCGGDGWDRKTT
ncbi:hypothetical protein E2C01_003866 [Portunus trituberculatus]|uniref:Uncharacterized protein n=1 Tax=Portunus trituberculatus TaxID=210409 RepID=A0A5B7CPS9_PORTR|nr:hypothetical protein [Portunus trituberculatus]